MEGSQPKMAKRAMKCSPCHSPAKGPTAIVCVVSTMKEGRAEPHITKQKNRSSYDPPMCAFEKEQLMVIS